MLSFRQLSRLFVVAATVAISIVVTPVRAQSSTPSATCDASFGADAGDVFQSASTALNASSSKASDFAPVAVSLAKIRIEYEDMTAPAGCEAGRQVLVKVAAFDEDVMVLNLLARLDSNNTRYVDFVTNTWQPRFNTFKASLSATATPATAASDASGVCANTDYQAQVSNDLNAMKSLDASDASAVGTALLNLLTTRYKYEDTAAPAGCDLARADMVKVLGTGEDSILGTMGAQADSANAAAYTDFLNNSVFPRGTKLYYTLNTDLGTPIATPAAAA